MRNLKFIDGWIPVALSGDIEPGASAGAVVSGYEIVIWRDMAGLVHIWEDRCPHRGMKLSFGFVRGDHIACLYHGWEFGPEGQCHKIPAHPELDVPSSICTKTYQSIEAFGIIWVADGFDGNGLDDETNGQNQLNKPKDPLGFDKDEDREILGLRSLYMDAPIADICEAVPDVFDAPVEHKGAYLSVKLDAIRLMMGLHPIKPDRSALHMVALGQPDLPMQQALLNKMQFLRLSVAHKKVA